MGFLNNQLYGHFLYCFGFNLEKKSCRKTKYLQSTVEYLQNNWCLHNWRCRKPQLINHKMLQNFGIGVHFLIRPCSKYKKIHILFHFNRRWNPQGWLYQASRWIGRSRGWRWFLRLRTLLGQIVRQGINHSANPNPIKRLVDFFNEENHFQTAHNLWHITSTLLQNGGLKNRLNNQDPKIKLPNFWLPNDGHSKWQTGTKKIREINRLYTFLIYFFSEVIS